MARQTGRFWRVADVISHFIALGCELRIAEPTVQLPDGDCLNVRYLLNVASGAFVPLVDLDDADKVSDSEVVFWERRLGLRIPRPDTLN